MQGSNMETIPDRFLISVDRKLVTREMLQRLLNLIAAGILGAAWGLWRKRWRVRGSDQRDMMAAEQKITAARCEIKSSFIATSILFAAIRFANRCMRNMLRGFDLNFYENERLIVIEVRPALHCCHRATVAKASIRCWPWFLPLQFGREELGH